MNTGQTGTAFGVHRLIFVHRNDDTNCHAYHRAFTDDSAFNFSPRSADGPHHCIARIRTP